MITRREFLVGLLFASVAPGSVMNRAESVEYTEVGDDLYYAPYIPLMIMRSFDPSVLK